jgi:hypothetical protein
MRPGIVAVILASLTLAGITPVAAGEPYSLAEKPRERDFWRNSYMLSNTPTMTAAQSKPTPVYYSDILAARMGVVDGQARLFRVDLDTARKDGRAIEGALGGKGVQLRLRW